MKCMETHAPKKKIYFDGGCRVCTAAADAYAVPEKYDRHDVSKHELPEGVTHDQAMTYMYVVEPDGKVLKGADAVMSVMDDHALLRWVAKVGRLPGFRQFAHALYRVVATHRYLFNTRRK